MKIFISYRRADSKYVVDRIRDRLIAVYKEDTVFRDIESIPLGEDFRDVLERATQGCNVMLVVIGPQWASITDAQGNKRLYDPNDYTRIEVETGLANKDILVIPILVMNAVMPSPQEIPESLSDLLYRNAISVRNDPDFDHDMERLITGINKNLGGSLPMAIEPFEPETVYIPEGLFWMGSQPGEEIPDYESPQREIFLPAFHIGICPVTNGQYEWFIHKTKRYPSPELGWDGQRIPNGFEEHPVTGVTWFEARDYCNWLSNETGHSYSIPNEAQWEKACRGGNNFIYPWGNELDAKRSNHGGDRLAPVRKFPPQNDFDIYDIVGNVRQWTCTLWGEKRIAPDPKYADAWKNERRNDLDANNSEIWRVVRGCSYLDDVSLLRSSARERQLPSERGFPGKRYGFRVARND